MLIVILKHRKSFDETCKILDLKLLRTNNADFFKCVF